MHLNVGKEVAALKRMAIKELQGKYAEVFSEGTRTNNKPWLIKRIAWRLQALAEGDLSERARRRAEELANEADLRLSAPQAPKIGLAVMERTRNAILPRNGDNRLPPPGTIITRRYKGETLAVKVLPKGFEFEGEVYRSLSAMAKAITGSHCNGYLFFGLTKEGGSP